MNDIIFSNSFRFFTFYFDKYKYTDNRSGAPQHYFAYMQTGHCKIATNSKTVTINEGDFFYIPNNCSYQSYWYGDPKIQFISLGFDFFPNPENKSYGVQTIPFDNESEELFIALSDISHISAKDIGVFYTLAGKLTAKMAHTSRSRTAEIVDMTKRYLFNNPNASIDKIAKNCAVSEAAIYSAFQKSSDITPNRLRGNIVLEKSKRLLVTTDKSIEDISNSLGFSSASYFRKKFKELFGITPTEMRKKYKL